MTRIGAKFMYVAGVMVCGAGTVIFGSVYTIYLYMLYENKNAIARVQTPPTEAPVQHYTVL